MEVDDDDMTTGIAAVKNGGLTTDHCCTIVTAAHLASHTTATHTGVKS